MTEEERRKYILDKCIEFHRAVVPEMNEELRLAFCKKAVDAILEYKEEHEKEYLADLYAGSTHGPLSDLITGDIHNNPFQGGGPCPKKEKLN